MFDLVRKNEILVDLLFKDDVLRRLGVQKKHLAFCLGSLVQPKQMLRLFNGRSEENSKILTIYHYLYKFSLERL